MGFYHTWAWRPSWSCDLDFLYTHWFPLPIDASYKIWLWLAERFQRRRSLKLWTDGRTPDHGHPISSPCEPNDSGELKIPSNYSQTFSSSGLLGPVVKNFVSLTSSLRPHPSKLMPTTRAEYRPLKPHRDISRYGKCISQCVLNISYKQESQFSISY